MRLMVCGARPPNQTGMGRWTGRGLMPASVTLCQRPVERDQVLGPQTAHQLDLLLGAAAPIMKILAERLVLDGVPAHADAEAEPAAAQHVHRGGLLRHERRLALRQDDDAGDELDALGDAGEVAEQHERLVELVGVAVGAAPALAARGVRAEHVVEGEQVVVAQLFGGLGVLLDGGGVGGYLGLGEDYA